MDKLVVLEDLRELPERVRSAALNVGATQGSLDAARRDLKRRRAVIAQGVALEMAEGPKGPVRRYANEAAREDETELRMAGDADAARLQANVAELERALDRCRIEYEYENNRLKAALGMARLYGGQPV